MSKGGKIPSAPRTKNPLRPPCTTVGDAFAAKTGDPDATRCPTTSVSGRFVAVLCHSLIGNANNWPSHEPAIPGWKREQPTDLGRVAHPRKRERRTTTKIPAKKSDRLTSAASPILASASGAASVSCRFATRRIGVTGRASPTPAPPPPLPSPSPSLSSPPKLPRDARRARAATFAAAVTLVDAARVVENSTRAAESAAGPPPPTIARGGGDAVLREGCRVRAFGGHGFDDGDTWW